LTSAAALSALQELPTTNPAFHHTFSLGKTNQTMVDNELAFPDDNGGINDGCDIPVDVVQSVVMSEGIVAKNRFFFALDGKGNIVRTGIAEDVEEIIELEELEVVKSTKLGHGHCAKTGSRKYGADWEEH
jgi:hypothetical protein